MKNKSFCAGISKLFGGLSMKWPGVIIFALVAGIYTGLIMMVPGLEETSLQDIGINFEWWVLFAVIIVVNCNKNYEAMLKCFVFFLISQPVVYLIEVIFGYLSFDQAKLYYFGIWLPRTFLTIPGGFIAYYCKKQDILGSIILGLGNTILAVEGLMYFEKAIENFPNHILSGLICILFIIVMSLCIQKEKKNRIISIAFPVVLTAVLLIILAVTGRSLY